MNTFLIKVGKSWQVIKRDGLKNGSRRVASAFFALFRSVGSGDILFISGGVGDSARYRTAHVAEELEFNGFACSVAVQDNPRLVSYVDKFSLFIFHRTLYTERIARMIAEIKKQKKTIIFETDDLVYDPKYLKHMDYYKKMNSLEKKLYDNGVGGEILRDDYVKVATTTTKFLADKLQHEGKQVFVVPNKLSVEDVKNATEAAESYRTFKGTVENNKQTNVSSRAKQGEVEKSQNDKSLCEEYLETNRPVCSEEGQQHSKCLCDCAKPKPLAKDGERLATKQSICAENKSQKDIIKLGYFSGTISHNKDFATITNALMTIMEKYQNVELLLVGPLDVKSELVKKFGDRIKQLPYVPRKQHFANVAQCDINLAPLEYDNPFCEAKSELKFFEAGAVHVPTVAVSNQTYQDTIEEGVDGLVAQNTDEWVEKLSQLIEDRNLRLQMGRKAYQKSKSDYTTKNANNKEYYEYLRHSII